MALFKSALITAASGSIGGLTLSRNKGGMYIRARAIPTNPSSEWQEAVRGYMSHLSSYWANTLDATERESWKTYASNVKVINRMGDLVYISGFNHFLRSNLPRLLASLPIVESGPTVFNLGNFTPIVVTATVAAGLSVAFTVGDAWRSEDDSALLLYMSQPQQPTINYYKGPYRYTGQVTGDSGTPPTSPQIVTPELTLVAATKCFLRCNVTRADGRLSATQFLYDTVAA